MNTKTATQNAVFARMDGEKENIKIKRTPTPLKIHYSEKTRSNTVIIRPSKHWDSGGIGIVYAKTQIEEDAIHIVKCVNMFDSMVRECELMLDYLRSQADQDSTLRETVGYKNAHYRLTEILNKAKGGIT